MKKKSQEKSEHIRSFARAVSYMGRRVSSRLENSKQEKEKERPHALGASGKVVPG